MAAPAVPALSKTTAADAWHWLETYVKRLPLLTRAVVLLIAICHFLSTFGIPVNEAFALDPGAMDLTQMHRCNTYPFVHAGLIHTVMNLFALTPLLTRFEKEVGTLKALLLIAGPIVTFPGFLYLGIEIWVLHDSNVVVGASALVFTFLAAEAVRTYGFQPYYTIAGIDVPSYTTPVLWMVLANFLVPGASALGHFCGLVVGYAYACRYLRLLEPAEWILAKVEGYLGFLLVRLPWYVSLEKRSELNYFEMLPIASPRIADGLRGTPAGGVRLGEAP